MSPTRLLPPAVLAVLALTGCAAGQNDATSHEHATPWVADARVGAVAVRDVTIVPSLSAQASASPAGSATATAFPSATATVGPEASATASPTLAATPSVPATSASPSPSTGGTQGYLTMTLVSSVPDTLIGASLSNGGTVTPSAAGGLTVRPQQALVIADPENPSSAGGTALGISGLSQPLQVGTTVRVTLTFQTAGSVSLVVPVRVPATA